MMYDVHVFTNEGDYITSRKNMTEAMELAIWELRVNNAQGVIVSCDGIEMFKEMRERT